MSINSDILTTWGGKTRKFRKNETVFREDQEPKWYYQILTGKVRMFNSTEEGKEFTQGIFGAGESFGEPPLLIGKPFPASAIALEDSVIYMLPKDTFHKVLHEYPEIKDQLLCVMANRVYQKSLSAKSLINPSPQTRILNFLTWQRSKMEPLADRVLIPLTRQEIANCTGLRVETVIRTLHQMNEEKVVDIRNHKLYF